MQFLEAWLSLSKHSHKVHLYVSLPARASADNDLYFPAQSALCVRRSSPALMEVIARVQCSASSAVRD